MMHGFWSHRGRRVLMPIALAGLVVLAASCWPMESEPTISEHTTSLTFTHDPYRINGDPVAVGNCGTLMMVVRRNDVGTVQARKYNGSWTNMWDLGAPDRVTINSGLAVNGANGTCYVFGRGSDGNLWNKVWFDNTSTWSQWWNFGRPALGTITSAPTISATSANDITVYVRGASGQVEAKTWNGSTWSGWYSIGGSISSAPHAFNSGATIYLSGRSTTTNMIAVAVWNGSKWSWSTKTVPTALKSATYGVKNGTKLYIFGVATTGAMQVTTYNGSTWSGSNLGGSFKSNPTGLADNTYTDVFAIGTNGYINAITHNGTSWGGAYSLNTIMVQTPSASLFYTNPRIYTIEADNNVYETAWTGSSWVRAINEVATGIIGTAKIDDELPNPGMGWMFEEFAYLVGNTTYYNTATCRPTSPSNGPFPLADTVEIIETWSWIERTKGTYDWSRVDESINYWTARGKRVSLRVTTEDIGCYGPFWDYPANPENGGCHGIPTWLKNELIASGKPMQIRDGFFEFPDYTSTIYKSALTSFLTAFAKKYRSNTHVDLVQLRGYGQWGEWHSGHDFMNLATRQNTLAWIIDQWVTPWNGYNKTFVVSGSYEYRSAHSSPPATDAMMPALVSNPYWDVPGYGYTEFMAYSKFDDILSSHANITFRRDGFDGNQDVLYPGPQYTIEPTLDGALLNNNFAARKKLPNLAEFKYNNAMTGSNLAATFNQVLQYHSNYLMLPGWSCGTGNAILDALTFYNNNLETYVKPALRAGGLGYRFEVAQGTMFTHLLPSPSTKITVNMTLTNKNVGRMWNPNYKFRFWLVNAAGTNVAGPYDVTLPKDLRELLKDVATAENVSFTITRPPNGDYRLMVALVDPTTNWPRVKLAFAGMDDETRYTIGTVRVY